VAFAARARVVELHWPTDSPMHMQCARNSLGRHWRQAPCTCPTRQTFSHRQWSASSGGREMPCRTLPVPMNSRDPRAEKTSPTAPSTRAERTGEGSGGTEGRHAVRACLPRAACSRQDMRQMELTARSGLALHVILQQRHCRHHPSSVISHGRVVRAGSSAELDPSRLTARRPDARQASSDRLSSSPTPCC